MALKTLSGVEQLRQDLLRLLNSAAGRIMLRPWLPAEGLGDPLAELFLAAIELRTADDRNDVGTAYRRLNAGCAKMEEILDHKPTHFGATILARTVEALSQAARRKLELKSPPARLTIDVSARPLPLLEAGVTVAVALTIANIGDASAQEVSLEASTTSENIRVVDEITRLGTLQPQTQQSARVDVLVESPTTEAKLRLDARWTNVDHTIGASTHEIELLAHEVHIDWEALERIEPFANYPVERADGLVGRSRQLDALLNAYGQAPLANQYVTGQRRVGKTSLVRVLTNELRAATPNLLIATVEMGEVRAVDGGITIGNLGRKLAQRSVRAADLTAEIEVPDFSDSLAPLTEVVEHLLEWDADLRFLFVVDEFDELPHETYRRDGAGDALFVPMRSLAQKPNVGWLLVGGEKMPFIRDEQAARLNNFREMSLDYLALHEDGRTRHSTDFAELVRRPLPNGFVVDDAAVRSIYDASAGNPHFAKELCATLFPRCVARRDALVTAPEVHSAALAAARERDVELFAHFWEDGIFGVEEERRRIELDRRSYLMAIAQLLRSGTATSAERVRAAAVNRGLEGNQIERLQTEFVRRGIFEELGATLNVHVPLFRLWLESEGVYKLPPRGLTEKIGQQAKERNEALKITNGEVRRLAQQWERFRFRGDRVSREAIDDWLEQFESLAEKRLAFRLLERLHVLTESEIFDGLRRLHRQVAAARTVRLRRGQRRLTHRLVSAVGGPGSSGEAFAYKYRQANNVSQTMSLQLIASSIGF